MTENGILMGAPPSAAAGAGARVTILFVLAVGFLIVLIGVSICRGASARAGPHDTSSDSHGWLWGWVAVFLANLPLPLLFGFAVTSGNSTLGMLAGVAVVWLIGHFAVARVRPIRTPLMFGGAVIAASQVLPLAQIVAGMLAMTAVTGRDVGLQSAPDGFAVTLLTAALLAVAALALGFVFHAMGRLIEASVSRSG